MIETNLTEEKALESYMNGIDCSQVVLAETAPQLGLDETTALKIAAAFGGGMWNGERCGCVTGALMALGLRYGHCEPGDTKAKNLLLEKKNEFEAAFKEAHGSLICKELLGYDLTVPEERDKVMEENLFATLCSKLACTACEILEDIID
ncbi:C-GCAxxG-C-C family protein [Eubacteriales bacterium DFI.9.88]|nr:C-GCAxxG-C-C family protein [Eubacteriales bacterium DFI.9.88]